MGKRGKSDEEVAQKAEKSQITMKSGYFMVEISLFSYNIARSSVSAVLFALPKHFRPIRPVAKAEKGCFLEEITTAVATLTRYEPKWTH